VRQQTASEPDRSLPPKSKPKVAQGHIPIKQLISAPPPPKAPPRRNSRGGGRWILAILGTVVVIAGAGYVASSYFSRATFTLVPKTVPLAVNGTYIAQGTATGGSLSYELATVRGSASTTVAASDGPALSTKAQGKVTIYNEYSSQSQRLIAGTRLANDSGLVYRLTSSVVVPGASTTTGKLVPGTLTTPVVADQPGQEYNLSRGGAVSDFRIVAYKGTPRYDTMYAKLASDISGGFSGTKKTVGSQLLASTSATLKAELIERLLVQLRNSVPSGYIFYDTANVPSFAEPTIGGTDSKSATITVTGSLTGIYLKKDDLVSRIAGTQNVETFKEFGYSARGIETLDLVIANPKEFSVEKKNSLIVRLKGNMDLIGSIPVEEIKRKVLGLPLTETQAVFKDYAPVLKSGSGELIPPWSKVPLDPDKITIKIEEK